MRLGAAVLAGLLLLCVPTVAASPEPYSFTDPAGDVTKARKPYTGDGADHNDILSASMRESGDELAFTLELKNLTNLPKFAQDPDFQAVQYALNFETKSGHQGYSMRAIYRTPGGASIPLIPNPGQWEFSIHDRETDDWPAVPGRATHNMLQWTISVGALEVGDEKLFTNWSATVWTSFDESRDQINDYAGGEGKYKLGFGPVNAATMRKAVRADRGEPFVFDDPVEDVTSQGKPVRGPGADTTDVVQARVFDAVEHLIFELQLRNLSGLPAETRDPKFHAQYAFSFVGAEGHAGYSMRAMFREDEWRFQVHDRQSDEWTAAVAEIRENTIQWIAEQPTFRIDGHHELREWRIQTWNSYESRDQYGDWAGTEDTLRLREAEASGHGTKRAIEDAVGASEAFEIPNPSAGVLLLAAAVLLGFRRRA